VTVAASGAGLEEKFFEFGVPLAEVCDGLQQAFAAERDRHAVRLAVLAKC
jgi:hypothetical protein